MSIHPIRLTRRTPLVRLAAAASSAAAIAIVCGVAAPSASALPYTVRPCSYAGTPAVYTGSQLLSTDGDTTADNRCSTGDGYRLRFHGPDDTALKYQGNGFRIMIPAAFPNASIISLGATITIAPRTGAGGGLYTIDETNGGYDPSGGPQLTFAAGAQVGPSTYYQAPHSPSRSVIWRLSSDDATSYDPTAIGGDFVLNSVAISLDDPTAPLPATATTTGLLDGTPQTGKAILSLTDSDTDSGVQSIQVNSGAARVASLTATTSCTFVSVEACPTKMTGDVVVDTTKLPDGPQSLSLVSTDAAGNKQTSTTPTFTVANNVPAATPAPAPLVANGNPKGTPIVTAGRTTKKAAKTTHATARWQAPVTVSGRLLAADGTPMPSVTLDITQTTKLPGAAPVKLATVTTDATGAYHYSFAATASSTVSVLYPQHLGAADYSASRAIDLSVRTHVTFKRASPLRRGKPVTFRGHVDATTIPTGGVRVAVQYHSVKGAWLTAGLVTTSPTGDFTWKHTFHTAAAYRLRARVLTDRRLSTDPGNSGEARFTLR